MSHAGKVAKRGRNLTIPAGGSGRGYDQRMSQVVTVTLNPALDLTVEVDRLEPFNKLRGRQIALDAGGGGINVSRVLHRFGVPTVAILPAGGSSGTALIGAIEREDVPTRRIDQRRDTRRTVTIWEVASREHFRILTPGEPLEDGVLDECIAATAAEPRPDVIVLSGSMPPGTPAGSVARFSEIARNAGARFVVDTSGPALVEAVEVGADMIKPSLNELRDLVEPEYQGVTMDEFDYRAAAHMVAARGVGAVVVSLGEDGAYMATRDGRDFELPTPEVEVLSSVGAGDSMVAGIIVGLLRGRDLGEAFRFGVAAGAATCMVHGTELCRPGEVEYLDSRMARAS